jgi:3-deoxy-D-manno-octulosonate 8-phosphate phosphatase (KDO 8-P phosphatase)
VSSSPEELLRRARAVRAIVLDVDGVLTDAGLIYGARGETLKAFSARDGFAVKLAQGEGIRFAVLSGRLLPAVKARLADLGIARELTIQGSRDKRADVEILSRRLELALDQLAFMGDDVPDLPVLARVGLAACPADATEEARGLAHFVCPTPGGRGAVRDLVRLILDARGRWRELMDEWAAGSAATALFGGPGAA